jgi:hypothetical protein
MSHPKLKLLEDRLLQAVARVRSLREEHDRVVGELREMRRRLEEFEREREITCPALDPEMAGDARGAIEAAIRELREEEIPAVQGGDSAPKGGA